MKKPRSKLMQIKAREVKVGHEVWHDELRATGKVERISVVMHLDNGQDLVMPSDGIVERMKLR